MFIISLRLFSENKIDGQQSITLRQPFVFFRERPLNDGTDGVEHIISGQMIGRRDLCTSARFRMSLRLHEFVALQAKLNLRCEVFLSIASKCRVSS